MSAAPTARWGLPEVLAGTLGFVLLSAVAHALGRVPAVSAQPQLVWTIDQVMAGWLPLAAVVLVASYARGRRSLRRDFGLRFEPRDIVIGLVAGLALRAVAVGVAELARLIAGAPATPFAGGVAADALWWVLTAVVAASLVTPVVEELFFRGLVLRWLYRVSGGGELAAADERTRVGGAVGVTFGGPESTAALRVPPAAGPAVVAVLGSALLFTLFHLAGVPESAAAVSRLVTLFVLGLVLGVMTVLTRRLGPAILTHVVFNLSVAALDLVVSLQG